jgi:hypothetical protein
MTALLSLLTGGNGLIAGLVAVLIAVGGAWLKGRSMGVNSERSKQIARDAAAMSEAQKIDEAVAGNDPDANRKELSKWAR